MVGDALAGLLEKAGFAVTREYYINDAGTQVDTLARSAHLRYREALGEEIGEIPPGMYPGAYLRDVGRALAARDGDTWLNRPEEDWLPEVRRFATDHLLEVIKADLHALGVDQAVFSSERSLVESGAVDEVFRTLEARGLLYVGVLEPPKGKTPEDWEPRPQTLFKATAFGDDVDRPLKKSDGTWTYFANDMAYHLDKYRRGFARQIDVWGADHGGYVKRMQAAVKALTEEQARLEVVLCQLVKLSKGGVEMKMSKRSGSFVTLRELIDEVGKDVVRFIMLTRKADAQLDFDLDKVLEQSRDNPVFYVQYAHARAHSVLRHAAAEFAELPQDAEALAAVPLERLTDSAELALIKQMANWPRVVEQAAVASEPHRVAFYLYDLAAGFHGLWTKGKGRRQPALPARGRSRGDRRAPGAGQGAGADHRLGPGRHGRRARHGDALRRTAGMAGDDENPYTMPVRPGEGRRAAPAGAPGGGDPAAPPPAPGVRHGPAVAPPAGDPPYMAGGRGGAGAPGAAPPHPPAAAADRLPGAGRLRRHRLVRL